MTLLMRRLLGPKSPTPVKLPLGAVHTLFGSRFLGVMLWSHREMFPGDF